MNSTQRLEAVCNFIQQQAPDFVPRIGLILGSGLGGLADQVENPVTISYKDIPGFPVGKVAGHKEQMVLGKIQGVPIICMQGRVHGYEGVTNDDFKVFIRTIKKLGATSLLITNASGSLRSEVGPGELVLVTDHINLQLANPLIGDNDDEFGTRFTPMDEVYNLQLRQALLQSANEVKVQLHQGVACAVIGPCYETPAEIRAFRLLGADLVGMSLTPEAILACHCGLKTVAVSMVTNFATGVVLGETHDHQAVLASAERAAGNLAMLIKHFLQHHSSLLYSPHFECRE